ncbi:MAG TPA: hypothetical protein H9809_08390, partial [Candidatus Blautia pullicola]|nr:hypothetical protein [Candidatus Blautia pullicola]
KNKKSERVMHTYTLHFWGLGESWGFGNEKIAFCQSASAKKKNRTAVMTVIKQFLAAVLFGFVQASQDTGKGSCTGIENVVF